MTNYEAYKQRIQKIRKYGGCNLHIACAVMTMRGIDCLGLDCKKCKQKVQRWLDAECDVVPKKDCFIDKKEYINEINEIMELTNMSRQELSVALGHNSNYISYELSNTHPRIRKSKLDIILKFKEDWLLGKV